MECLFNTSVKDIMLDMQENSPKVVDKSVEIEIKKIVEVFAYLLVNAIYISSKENGRNVISSQDVLLGCEEILKIFKGGNNEIRICK